MQRTDTTAGPGGYIDSPGTGSVDGDPKLTQVGETLTPSAIDLRRIKEKSRRIDLATADAELLEQTIRYRRAKADEAEVKLAKMRGELIERGVGLEQQLGPIGRVGPQPVAVEQFDLGLGIEADAELLEQTIRQYVECYRCKFSKEILIGGEEAPKDIFLECRKSAALRNGWPIVGERGEEDGCWAGVPATVSSSPAPGIVRTHHGLTGEDGGDDV